MVPIHTHTKATHILCHIVSHVHTEFIGIQHSLQYSTIIPQAAYSVNHPTQFKFQFRVYFQIYLKSGESSCRFKCITTKAAGGVNILYTVYIEMANIYMYSHEPCLAPMPGT